MAKNLGLPRLLVFIFMLFVWSVRLNLDLFHEPHETRAVVMKVAMQITDSQAQSQHYSPPAGTQVGVFH